jgi:HD-like signal output (HDOD) protein
MKRLPAADLNELRSLLAHALASPQAIAPMPRVCVLIADIAAQPNADARQLVRAIQSDAALAGAVMRVANSPAMRLRASASSLQEAVSWLGISEVRNVALAKALRGEVFAAPGRQAECERLWCEALLSALWAREVARYRDRRLVETAFLAGLMHRTGAALAYKIISRFEVERQQRVEEGDLAALLAAVEPSFCRLLMGDWRLTGEVRDAASGWADYPDGNPAELAGVTAAARRLALHTLEPDPGGDDAVVASPVFAALGMDPVVVRRLLERRDQVQKGTEF